MQGAKSWEPRPGSDLQQPVINSAVVVLILQVFVANPNKPQPIVDILTNNREKLLKYLEDFHTERGKHFFSVAWTASRSC